MAEGFTLQSRESGCGSLARDPWSVITALLELWRGWHWCYPEAPADDPRLPLPVAICHKRPCTRKDEGIGRQGCPTPARRVLH